MKLYKESKYFNRPDTENPNVFFKVLIKLTKILLQSRIGIDMLLGLFRVKLLHVTLINHHIYRWVAN